MPETEPVNAPAPAPDVAYVIEEWGIERQLPNWNNGEPYIEWGGWAGIGGSRVDYTADNVFGLAGGRPVFSRVRTVYRDRLTEPTRVYPPGNIA